MHEKGEKVVLVDWITITVSCQSFCWEGEGEEEAFVSSDRVMLDRLLAWMGITTSTDWELKHGLYGYKYGFYLGGIRICWDGSGASADTIMIDMSGEGCRLYESLAPDMEWLAFVRKITAQKWYHISRLDIACDTFGTLRMRDLIRYSLEGRYKSRWKSVPRVVQGREETIDFGSPQSRVMLRIYNKTLERRCKADVKPEEVPEGWVRCEFQFRNKAVESFVRSWQESGDVAATYFGLMANQLQFLRSRSAAETNFTRFETVPWWRRFLADAVPIKLAYRGGLEYNLDTLGRYVFQQAGSSIHAWLALHDWDVEHLARAVEARPLNERQSALAHKLGAVLAGPSRSET